MYLSIKSLGCTTIVTTTDDEGLPYADGSWHTLKAVRKGGNGTIILDNKWKGYFKQYLYCLSLLINYVLFV